MKERYLPGPRLIKRSPESGLQLAGIGEQPVKDKKIYTSFLQTMALSHLKPNGCEQVDLPYDLFCSSVQKKLAEKGGSRYQCVFAKCKKIFTTLELAKLHLKITGHKKLAMQRAREDETTDEDELTLQTELR